MKWPICGPKLSLCYSLISIWGLIQFLLMGIFFFIEAAPLLDDFTASKNISSSTEFASKLQEEFRQRAYNCWVAAFLYVGLLVFAGSQFMTNQKRSALASNNMPTSISSPFGQQQQQQQQQPLSGVTTEENGIHRQYGLQLGGDSSET